MTVMALIYWLTGERVDHLVRQFLDSKKCYHDSVNSALDGIEGQSVTSD